MVDMFVLCGSVGPQSGRKETVLDLAKFVDRGVSVKLSGGRQGWLFFIVRKCVQGTLLLDVGDVGTLCELLAHERSLWVLAACQFI